MRRFLIDVNIDSGNAATLIMTLKYPDVTVEAITVVAGNVPVDQYMQNALYTLASVGECVPKSPSMPQSRGAVPRPP
jgi:purine nucleosidase